MRHPSAPISRVVCAIPAPSREQPPPGTAWEMSPLQGRHDHCWSQYQHSWVVSWEPTAQGWCETPTWGEELSRGPTPGAILGMSFDEVLCSSRLDQTGCFLGGAERTQRETQLCRQSQGDPALAPSPSLQPLSHLMSQSCSVAESQPLF